MPTQTITTLTADHVASSTGPCALGHEVRVSPYVVAEEGYCLAARALDTKEVYNQIEGADGVFRTVVAGEVIVGALGERQALKGYSGRIPRHVAPGDTLHVQNMGGILGRVAQPHPDLGPALRVEVLGAVLLGDPPRHARIQDTAIDPVETLAASAPLVFVSGTAMNTGKTYAAAALVAGLTARGLRVAAAKLTGAALQRDVRAMVEGGAVASASFVEAGAVATTGRDMVPIAKGLIAHLNRPAPLRDGTEGEGGVETEGGAVPDVLVLELGDGVIGPYGVDQILQDMELQRLTATHVLAAADLAGVWACDQLFRSRYRAGIGVVVGPATDTDVGRRYIQTSLGIPAVNARSEPDALAALVADDVRDAKAWAASPSPLPSFNGPRRPLVGVRDGG
ncbi:hypothetical protein RQM47_01845 [Rubrivirga sp. S365]|uniref:DUF1611 domain-containing protein n=1 Tax=Rubrivirga litoralis TaxID=3075598 RepID=A0ABU3BP97_9BACT|nr:MULTISPECIES: hypothetical protein [unclassified Rubrivirga]MDT0631110.1 hypothetical protein [Rubrivirga sp. F394]MDT7855377.1 hypothetical protein [Rubrivirga sp. S365]